MQHQTLRRALRSAGMVTAAGLAAAAIPSGPAAAMIPLGDGLRTQGTVALSWAPTYMSNDHTYSRAEAIALAKRVDIVGAMPPSFRSYTSEMRAAHPGLAFLAYSNSTMTSPAKAAGLPESAYAHDKAGRRIQIPSFNMVLMNPLSTAWRAQADSQCDQRSDQAGYNGCLMDNLGLGIFAKNYTTGVPVKPGTSTPYTQAGYRDALVSLANYFQNASPDKWHVGNSVENAYRYWDSSVSSQPLVKTQDAAQMEDFLRGAKSSVSAFPLGDKWVKNVNVVKDIEASGVIGLFSTKVWVNASDAAVRNWQRYSMGTFLMGANGDSYLAFTRSRDQAGSSMANAPYQLPRQIGRPQAAMVKLSSGAYARSFYNGLSLVNPTSGSITVKLGTSMRSLSGASVTSVRLAPHDADVLVGAPRL